MTAKTTNEMIAETYETVIEMKTALFGMPNTDDKGICGKVNDLKLVSTDLENRMTIVETTCKNTHGSSDAPDNSILPSSKKGKAAVFAGAGAGGVALLITIIEFVEQLMARGS